MKSHRWLERRRNFSVKHTRRYSGVVSRARNEKSSWHVLSTRKKGSANNPHGRFAKSDLLSCAVARSRSEYDRSRSLAPDLERVSSQPCPRGSPYLRRDRKYNGVVICKWGVCKEYFPSRGDKKGEKEEKEKRCYKRNDRFTRSRLTLSRPSSFYPPSPLRADERIETHSTRIPGGL